MNQVKNSEKLKKSLNDLEKAAQQIVNTRGYTKEAESIKMLNELIREQLINESANHTTRKAR